MNTPSQTIARYLAGKDGNRPAQFDHCFTPQATVHMVSNSDAVSFPDKMQGRQSIAKSIVRDFSSTYEDIYTFCLSAKPNPNVAQFSCPWVVAMTAKDDQSARLGWGQYDWQFDSQQNGLCSALTIHIDEMLVLRNDSASVISHWADQLPYPWCTANEMQVRPLALPANDQLQEWITRLAQAGSP